MGEQRRDREREGGEESGRGREKGGVIVGGRGGDSLVDGQKDKGKRAEGKIYVNGLVRDEETAVVSGGGYKSAMWNNTVV